MEALAAAKPFGFVYDLDHALRASTALEPVARLRFRLALLDLVGGRTGDGASEWLIDLAERSPLKVEPASSATKT
jgi:hypothetical protein